MTLFMEIAGTIWLVAAVVFVVGIPFAMIDSRKPGHKIAAVRSACVYCPYHSRDEWLPVRENEYDWQRALDLDEELEAAWNGPKSVAGLETEPFLTPERKRLRDTDFSEAGDLDKWLGECTGLCGI